MSNPTISVINQNGNTAVTTVTSNGSSIKITTRLQDDYILHRKMRTVFDNGDAYTSTQEGANQIRVLAGDKIFIATHSIFTHISASIWVVVEANGYALHKVKKVRVAPDDGSGEPVVANIKVESA